MSEIKIAGRKPKIEWIGIEINTPYLVAVLIMGQSFHYFRLLAKSIVLIDRSCLGIALGVILCVASSTNATAQSPSTVSGGAQYVLLDNDHVLTGTVFRQGNSVIVRRGNEAELTLRGNQVVAVENDLPQLYQARILAQHRRSAPTLSQRIGDARWCIDNALPAHATDALMKVYAVAPNHPIAIQLERRLRDLLEKPAASTSMTMQAVATAQFNDDSDSGDAIQSVGHTETVTTQAPRAFESDTLVHASAAPASLHEFTAKVQPILLARCSQCHHEQSGVATNWNLALPPGGSRRMTQPGSLANLNATLPFCDSSDPKQSKLVQKAIIAHGRMSPNRPPIAEYETALAATLTRWISTLRAESQQLAAPDSIPKTIEPVSFMASDGINFPPLNPINPADVASSLNSPQPVPAWSEPSIESSTAQSSDPGPVEQRRPSRLPTIDNPNDVEQFNRETRLRRRLGLR